MKKILLTAVMLPLMMAAAFAQSANSAATQAVNLNMSDAIELTILSGANPQMNFVTVNDYANGVVSAEQQLQVRSNKKFNVRVKAKTSRFSFAGAGKDPKMPLSVLRLKVYNNNTGGIITSGYQNFSTLSTGSKSMINNATPGGSNTFSVQYRATPGFTYPAGTYAMEIIYTATQA